ncbi:hypothetical protein PanWU01x14_256640, partial [Parasponia andersonii]
MQLITNYVNQVLQHHQQLPRAQVAQAPHPGGVTLPVYEQFRRIKPSSFQGGTDPLIVEGWIKELEHVFRLLTCTDQQRVECAIFMMKGEAAHWWEMTDHIHNTQANPIRWNRFKEIFFEKYFPYSMRQAKEIEFINLV